LSARPLKLWQMDKVLGKVTTFITRERKGLLELLLFEHPNAGIQIPAGTMEEGEVPEESALREAGEESGLSQLELVNYIGSMDMELPEREFVILKRTKVYSRPDPTSFDWAEFPRGHFVSANRIEDGFIQVTHTEWDRYPDPQWITYSITGWVPSEALGRRVRRHFFHLKTEEATRDSWELYMDNHIFKPFWAPMANLPQIIQPQNAWLEYVVKELGYRFRHT
jgi:8-oxo-dGTP pyrophosphatase MutT (NUDIX family)